MITEPYSIILAEDDEDDRLIFQDALNELSIATTLTIVNDGVELMEHLRKNDQVAEHVLFLDINMPRKNGIECIIDIKNNDKYSALPIIVFSTCFEKGMIEQLYELGANYYMRKPNGFLRLQDIIERSLDLMQTNGLSQPTKDKFILNVI